MKSSDVVQSLRKKSESVYGGDFVILNLPNQEKGNLFVEIPF